MIYRILNVAMIISLIFKFSYSQSPYHCHKDTVKGYLIIDANKTEVLNRIKLEKKNTKTKWTLPVDVEHTTYFLPCDTNKIFSDILKTTVECLTNAGYVRPNRESSLLVKKYCGDTSVKCESLNQKVFQNAQNWFTVKGNKKRLYRCFYLEAVAVKAKIDNTYLNNDFLNLIYHIKKDINFFDCYIMFRPIKFFEKKVIDNSTGKSFIEKSP